MSSGFTCWWTSWLVSVMVSNRWKEGGMTRTFNALHLREFLKKKKNQKPSRTLQQRSCFAHVTLVQGKCGLCLVSCLYRLFTILVKGLELSCLPLCLTAPTANLNGITMPHITFTTQSHPVIANNCKGSAAPPEFSCCHLAPNLN